MIAIAEYLRRFRKQPAIWLAVIVAVLVVASLVSHYVKADDAPPKSTLKVCGGPLPSLSLDGGAEGGCFTYDVSATSIHDPGAPPDHLAHDDEDEYRHIYFVEGDPACVMTGYLHRGARFPYALGSGRDLNRSSQEHVAYVAQGYGIFATTGASCSEIGVSLCRGGFCR